MSKSLMSDTKVCYICGTPFNLHKHHIFGGANRKRSEKDGCWVYLCADHHNMSDRGVHFNKYLDTRLKQDCEKRWMVKNEKSEYDFIKKYGRNYL